MEKGMYEIITEMYPGRAFLKKHEVARIMGVNIKTVTAAIERKYNPLPARNLSNGIKRKTYIIPIDALCRWSEGKRLK